MTLILQERPKNLLKIDQRYGDFATLYNTAGWEGVLPIPYRQKSMPPKGTTGEKAQMPSVEQLKEWRTANAG